MVNRTQTSSVPEAFELNPEARMDSDGHESRLDMLSETLGEQTNHCKFVQRTVG